MLLSLSFETSHSWEQQTPADDMMIFPSFPKFQGRGGRWYSRAEKEVSSSSPLLPLKLLSILSFYVNEVDDDNLWKSTCSILTSVLTDGISNLLGSFWVLVTFGNELLLAWEWMMYEYENVRGFFFGITPPIAGFEKRFFQVQVHEGRRHLLTSALDALSLTVLENLEIYFKKGPSWSTFKIFNKTREFCCSKRALVQLNGKMITNLNLPPPSESAANLNIIRLYCCRHWKFSILFQVKVHICVQQIWPFKLLF